MRAEAFGSSESRALEDGRPVMRDIPVPLRQTRQARPNGAPESGANRPVARPPFPFAAIVAQEEMKTALILAAIDPLLGGVLIFGERGTGKSTAVRALAALLPQMPAIAGCAYSCEPGRSAGLCGQCEGHPQAPGRGAGKAKGNAKALARTTLVPVPVVDLPLGATEDRLVGALDLERALAQGEKAFQPGLLARAHRGFLYIDEVNLLEDHLVDVLLDVAASGENVVEREGLSIRHPARFVLVGSGNPEEGELRPQLLDRFGLSVNVETPADIETRIEVVRRRDAYDRDPAAFVAEWRGRDGGIRRKIAAGRRLLPAVEMPEAAYRRAAELCMHLGTDGLRGELTLIRGARALAAYRGRERVGDAEIREVAPLALRHRLRRSPLDEVRAETRVERGIAEIFGAPPSGPGAAAP